MGTTTFRRQDKVITESLRARNAFEVDLEWNDGQLRKASILSVKGNRCRVLLPANKKVVSEKGTTLINSKQFVEIVTFDTSSGSRYFIL